MSENKRMRNGQQHHRVRKQRRKRFHDNAKSFGKKGIYGRGSIIADEQYQYFINILDALNKNFESNEEKALMSTNVLQQTLGQEIHLASNQIVCKVMESLLGYVDTNILEKYFEIFLEDLRPICSDRFASYVLQKLIEVAFLRSIQKDQILSHGNEWNDDELINQQNNNNNNQLNTTIVQKSKKQKKHHHDLLNNNQQQEQEQVNEIWYNLNMNFPDSHRTKCQAFVLRIGKFLLNNLENFMWDQCANHIIRTSLLSLTGIQSTKESFKQQTTEMIMKQNTRYQVPDEWIEVAKEYAERIQMWPQFSDLPYQDQPSGLLGIICFILRIIDNKLYRQFTKKIINETFLPIENGDEINDQKPKMDDNMMLQENNDNDKEKNEDDDNSLNIQNYPKVFGYRSSVVLLETIINLTKTKHLEKIYSLLFTDRIYALSMQPLTNFAVQKLIQRITSKEDFERIFDQLSDHFEQLLQIGHTGIVQSLTATCRRLQTKEGSLFHSLQKALHILNHKERMSSFFKCLLKLKPYEYVINVNGDNVERQQEAEEEEEDNFIHLHGSLIIQDILYFHRPAFLVNCILGTPPQKLVAIFNTATGSFIANAFMDSKYVGEKSREKLLYHLENHYTQLANNKFGSRVFEICFQAAINNDSLKLRIAKELVINANQLKATIFGKIIYQKLHLDTYRLSIENWKNTIKQIIMTSSSSSSKRKAQKMFEDLIAN